MSGQIIHAVMYRDYKLGTLCDSQAWGPPMLFTMITDRVTCPGCRGKLDGEHVAFPASVGPTAAGCFVPAPQPIKIPTEGLTLKTEAKWLNADGTTSPVLPAAMSAVPTSDDAEELAKVVHAEMTNVLTHVGAYRVAQAVLAAGYSKGGDAS